MLYPGRRQIHIVIIIRSGHDHENVALITSRCQRPPLGKKKQNQCSACLHCFHATFRRQKVLGRHQYALATSSFHMFTSTRCATTCFKVVQNISKYGIPKMVECLGRGSSPFSSSILVSMLAVHQKKFQLKNLPPSLISMLHARLSIPNSAAILGEARFTHNIS